MRRDECKDSVCSLKITCCRQKGVVRKKKKKKAVTMHRNREFWCCNRSDRVCVCVFLLRNRLGSATAIFCILFFFFCVFFARSFVVPKSVWHADVYISTLARKIKKYETRNGTHAFLVYHFVLPHLAVDAEMCSIYKWTQTYTHRSGLSCFSFGPNGNRKCKKYTHTRTAHV